jgi:hypothetical protein
MAYYLVTATATGDLGELRERLESGEIRAMRPFGKALHHSLTHARRRPDGRLVWEEEDYCSPPLAMERAAVLDRYFSGVATERVSEGQGWEQVKPLPSLWPEPLD